MCCKGGLVRFGWQGPPDLHGHRTVLETAVLLLHQAPSWSGWQASHLRPPRPERGALLAAPHPDA